MTEAVLHTPLCIYMTTKTLLRAMLHHLSPNEGRMHFFALLPHQLTKYSNAMAIYREGESGVFAVSIGSRFASVWVVCR